MYLNFIWLVLPGSQKKCKQQIVEKSNKLFLIKCRDTFNIIGDSHRQYVTKTIQL